MIQKTFFITLLCFPLLVSAQADGSVPPSTSPTVEPSQATTSDVTTPPPVDVSTRPQSTPTTTSVTSPGATTPLVIPAVVPANEPRATTSAVAQPASVPAVPLENTQAVPTTTGPAIVAEETNSFLWIVIALLAVVPFGYVLVQFLKKEPKKKEDTPTQCFDLQAMLDEKVKEMTDLRAQLESKVKDTVKEQVRESLSGTNSGEILLHLEEAEKEYGRIKKLFEECKVEFGGSILKGVIIKNSLRDESILKKVTIEKTLEQGNWTLHDVEVKEGQLTSLAEQLLEGPWCMHFWKPGMDDVTVHFKDRQFKLKSSDKSTWAEAVSFGVSKGISVDQLDFNVR